MDGGMFGRYARTINKKPASCAGFRYLREKSVRQTYRMSDLNDWTFDTVCRTLQFSVYLSRRDNFDANL